MLDFYSPRKLKNIKNRQVKLMWSPKNFPVSGKVIDYIHDKTLSSRKSNVALKRYPLL